MKMKSVLGALSVLTILSSCSHFQKKCDNSAPLQGTDTAVVGVYIDKNGYPQAAIEKVDIHPGQRIFFAGPNQFDIFFKDQRAPNGQLENRSNNGVVVIDIPKDIFERSARTDAGANANLGRELIYRYGIRTNGKETDPIIRITPTGQ